MKSCNINISYEVRAKISLELIKFLNNDQPQTGLVSGNLEINNTLIKSTKRSSWLKV